MAQIVHPELVHPSDFVTITGGTAYTVPAGKWLVMTGLCDTGVDTQAEETNVNLTIDTVVTVTMTGGTDAATGDSNGSHTNPSVMHLPVGIAAAGGAVVDITTTGSTPRANTGMGAYGYLVGSRTPGGSLP